MFFLISFWLFFGTAKHYKDNDQIPIYGLHIASDDFPNTKFDYSYIEKCPIPETFPTIPKKKRVIDMIASEYFQDLTIRAKFDIPAPETKICSRKLSEEEKEHLTYAIRNNFYIKEMFDDYPFWIPIGIIKNNEVMIYTHTHYVFSEYNQIVTNAYANASNLVSLDTQDPIKFTYSIEWKSNYKNEQENTPLHYSLIAKQAKSVSLFFQIILLTTTVFLYKKMQCKYISSNQNDRANDNDMWETNDSDDKLVFLKRETMRTPEKSGFISVITGAGSHALISLLSYFLISTNSSSYWLGYPLGLTYVALFISCAPISGYISSSISNQYGMKNWQLGAIIMFVVICLLPGIALTITSFSSLVNSEAVPEMDYVLMVFGIAAGVYMAPLLFLGSFLGSQFPYFSEQASESGALPIKNKRPFYLKWQFVGSIFSLVFILYASYFFNPIIDSYCNNQFEIAYSMLFRIFLTYILMAIAFGSIYIFLLLEKNVFQWQWSIPAAGSLPGAVICFILLYRIVFTLSFEYKASLLFFIIWSIVVCIGVSLSGAAISFLYVNFILKKLFVENKIE